MLKLSKKGFFIGLAAFVLVMANIPCVGGQPRQRLSLVTSTPGGVIYVLGGGMANIVSKYIPWLQVNTEVSGGYAANVQLVGTKQAELGYSSAKLAYEGYRGLGQFSKQKYTNLRGIGAGSLMTLQLFTRKDSTITKVQDFKGKRIIIGPPGSHINVLSQVILRRYGFEMKRDWQPVYVSWGEVARTLRDRVADAGMITASLPVTALMELSTTHEIRLLPLDEGVLQQLLKEQPFWSKTTIPAGIYKGQDTKVGPVFKEPAVLLAREDIPKETIYAFTKALYEHIDELAPVHSTGKQWTTENAMLVKTVLPFHPGAEKYFREIGLLK
jgi:TRAP transporter TAXI family solute receptor